MGHRREEQRKTLLRLDYFSLASHGPVEGVEQTRRVRFSGIWKVRSWKAASRESFPEGNDAMAAALNLEVIYFTLCGGELEPRRFS